MDDGKMSMNKISGLVSFSMKVTQGLDVTETNYDTSGILYKKMKSIIYFSMRQILRIIQLQSVELNLIKKKFEFDVMDRLL